VTAPAERVALAKAAEPAAPPATGLVVRGASVRFGTTAALADVDLDVGPHEVVALLGPSGCGKSTLLRAIAGLQPLDAGSVAWAGQDLAGVPPHRRGVGLVFQDHALFPHRSVGDNVAFGLRMQRVGRRDRVERVAEVLALVGLAGYEDRSVATLSGGESQRVAVARALAPRPRVLLLDEPLASLDRALRDRLAAELPSLLRTEGVAAVHVTHDQAEAFALADRVVVLRAGRVVQVGTPEALWRAPGDAWVARLLGLANVWATTVHGGRAPVPGGSVAAPRGVADGPATLVVRPDAWAAAEPGGPADVRGVVAQRTFRGDHVHLVVETGDGVVTVVARGPAPPPLGAPVALVAAPDGVVAVRPDPAG
jgi:thiamine transport system ATP-binding protein